MSIAGVRDSVREWLADEVHLAIHGRGRASVKHIYRWMSLADEAEREAAALAERGSRGKGWATVYAGDLAWVAVALDTFGHDPSGDGLWNRFTALWKQIVVDGQPTDYRDPIAEAWRSRPGSTSWCLGRSLLLVVTAITTALAVATGARHCREAGHLRIDEP